MPSGAAAINTGYGRTQAEYARAAVVATENVRLLPLNLPFGLKALSHSPGSVWATNGSDKD